MVNGVGAPAGVAGTEKNAEARPLIVCNCTAAVTPLTVTPASAAPPEAPAASRSAPRTMAGRAA